MRDKTKRDVVLEEYRPVAGERVSLLGVAYLENPVKVFDMADEIVRLRAILDKLREPSESMVADAAEYVLGYHEPDYRDIRTAIVVAVAAAEQEVGRE